MEEGLRQTKFGEGEKIVFGPARTADTSALGVASHDRPGDATYTTIRIVCVTNQRVIVESGDALITIPTKDIQIVLIKRIVKRNHLVGINLLGVSSRHGRKVQLDIPNLEPEREPELQQIFPNAQIKERKGLTGFLDSLLD
jgi:hypothetical protein